MRLKDLRTRTNRWMGLGAAACMLFALAAAASRSAPEEPAPAPTPETPAAPAPAPAGPAPPGTVAEPAEPTGAAAVAASAKPAGLSPFAAHYIAQWHGINVGTSDLMLENGAQAGTFHYKWTVSARGIFRLVYSNDVVQQSWFSLVEQHVRPDRYFAEDGNSNVSLQFDWDAKRLHGRSEGKPVEIRLKPGTQDLMSIQVEVMMDLQSGEMPGTYHIVEKDSMKDFLYAREGTARIDTALGPLDTLIVSSRRAGNDRILRMWFAPALGYVPVQAERERGGKLEFAMRIKTLNR